MYPRLLVHRVGISVIVSRNEDMKQSKPLIEWIDQQKHQSSVHDVHKIAAHCDLMAPYVR
jgi:hypothetical protein